MAENPNFQLYLYYLQGNKIEMTENFSLETTGTRRKWNDIFKHWQKRTVNPEFYIQGKYPLGMKLKFRYSQMKEN